MQPVTILVLLAGVPAATIAALAERFDVLGPGSPDEIEALVSAHGARIRGIATTGKARLDRALLARLPALELIACPGGPANRGLVDRSVIAALGPDATLVNIARGEIVDELALVEALASGRLGSAGLDVFADEPNVPPALRELDNVVLAPHLGGATIETRHAMGESVVRSLERLLNPA